MYLQLKEKILKLIKFNVNNFPGLNLINLKPPVKLVFLTCLVLIVRAVKIFNEEVEIQVYFKNNRIIFLHCKHTKRYPDQSEENSAY
jgi:hypothetical protein